MKKLYKGLELVSRGYPLTKGKIYTIEYIDNTKEEFYVLTTGAKQWFSFNSYKEFFKHTKGVKMKKLYKGLELVSRSCANFPTKGKIYTIEYIDNTEEEFYVLDSTGAKQWFSFARYKEFFKHTKGVKMKNSKIVEVIDAEVLNIVSNVLYINDIIIDDFTGYNADVKVEFNNILDNCKKKEVAAIKGKALGILCLVRGLNLVINQRAWGALRYLEDNR